VSRHFGLSFIVIVGLLSSFPISTSRRHSYLISKGYLAVDMFFILSGLVMAHVYRRAFSEGVGEHYRGFLVARIARLAPERPKQICNRRKFPSGSTRMREQIFRGVPDVTNRA
jgi:hypothetical protein